jgi:hypothetical protein
MHTTNYTDTFIAVADDCAVTTAEVPTSKGDKPTIASLQYDILHNNPYKFDSDDVIFNTYALRNDLTKNEIPAEREKFFSKGQACMRSSPLAKRYGWGVHSDDKGKIALYAVESPEYKKMLKNKSLKQVKAMRSKKA